MQGSTTAQLALLLWIPLALLLISSAKSAQQGFLLVLFGGILFLPERMFLTIPGVAPLNKHSLTAIVAWIGLLLFHPSALRRGPRTGSAGKFSALLLVSGIATWIGNPDALGYGALEIPGQTYKDMILALELVLLRMALPYYLGLCLFRTADDLRLLLRGLVYAALIYLPLVLLEIRFAPILHTKVYGYFQHEFAQARRMGGFRAFVFMSHGLSVAFFLAQATIATAALGKIKDQSLPLSNGKVGLLLSVTLVASKSAASLIYGALLAPLILFTKARRQVSVARWLSIGVLAYPMARLYDIIPTEKIFEKVWDINQDRAGSLKFRFMNEDVLLERALERRWFGWGWSGRNMQYDEAGGTLSVVDGEWIIHMGQGGVVKFLIVFGVLLLPIWRINKVLKLTDETTAQLLSTCALLLAAQCVDLLPNSTSHSLPYVIAGAATSVVGGIRSTNALRAPGFR